jgi:hypothetical protein
MDPSDLEPCFRLPISIYAATCRGSRSTLEPRANPRVKPGMKSKTKEMNFPPASNRTGAATQSVRRREPSHDEISAFARTHWEKSGRPEGQDMAIWLEAERKLRSGIDLPSAEADIQADTRELLGEPSGNIESRLGPSGDRSATSL